MTPVIQLQIQAIQQILRERRAQLFAAPAGARLPILASIRAAVEEMNDLRGPVHAYVMAGPHVVGCVRDFGESFDYHDSVSGQQYTVGPTVIDVLEHLKTLSGIYGVDVVMVNDLPVASVA